MDKSGCHLIGQCLDTLKATLYISFHTKENLGTILAYGIDQTL